MLPERYGGVRRAVSQGTTRSEAGPLRRSHRLGRRRRRRLLLRRLRWGPQLPPARRPPPPHRPRRPAGPPGRGRARRRVHRLPRPLHPRGPGPPDHGPVLDDAARGRPHRHPGRPRRRGHHLPHRPGGRRRHGARRRARRLHPGAAVHGRGGAGRRHRVRLRRRPGRRGVRSDPRHRAARGAGPLAPHLAVPGRESLLLQGARIALADGPYRAAERQVLTTVGAALRLPAEDVARLLAAAARTPS